MDGDGQRPGGGEGVGEVLRGLWESFESGKIRRYEWRAAQLKGISRMINDEGEIMEALQADLSKPHLKSFIHEVSSMLTSFPSSAGIVPMPLGVVLVISAWNYPFSINDLNQLEEQLEYTVSKICTCKVLVIFILVIGLSLWYQVQSWNVIQTKDFYHIQPFFMNLLTKVDLTPAMLSFLLRVEPKTKEQWNQATRSLKENCRSQAQETKSFKFI